MEMSLAKREEIILRIKRQMPVVEISTQKELAKRVGMKPSTVNAHLKARMGFSINALRRYAQALEVSIQFLYEGQELNGLQTIHEIVEKMSKPQGERNLPRDYGIIPLLTTVPAGEAFSWEDPYPMGYAAEYVPNLGWKGEHLVGLKVTGESMIPKLYPGDIVIVDLEKEFTFSRRGKIGVVQKNLEEAMVKWIYKRDDIISIESHNRDFKDLNFTIEFGDPTYRFLKIIGRHENTERNEDY